MSWQMALGWLAIAALVFLVAGVINDSFGGGR